MEGNMLDLLDLMRWEETVCLQVDHFQVNLIVKSLVFAHDLMSDGVFFIVKYVPKFQHLVIWPWCQWSGILALVLHMNLTFPASSE